MARFSPAAQLTRGALIAYLKPRLAMDSQPHCTAIVDRAVSGLTSRNYNQKQEPIRRALQRYTQGRLAQDNGINDLAALLGALAPEASQADQAPGMGQINSNPGGSAGPMSVTPSPDQGGGPPGMGGGAPPPPGGGGGGSPIDLIVKYLTEEGVAPEIINNIPAIVSQGGGGGGDSGMPGMQGFGGPGGMDAIVPRTQPGMDQEEVEGEPGSGAMRVMEPRGGSESDFRPESASDEMPGHDPRPWEKAEDEDGAEDELVPGEQDEQMGGVSQVSSEGKSSRVVNGGANDSRPVTRSAMDHAIRVAQDAAIRNQRAIRDAERFVRPWVGDIAMDSATHPADIYRGALKALGVKGADRLHPDALRPILEAQPKAGARMQQQQQRQWRGAQDSNAQVQGSFSDRFPDAALITVMQ